MNKVVSVNLNGRAYQLEEHGYGLLKTYLGEASDRLAKDPDRDEIIADLEQAIADKCEAQLGGTKNVVSDKAVTRIIADMGPVGAPDEAAADKPKPDADRPAKRFHLIKEGQMIGGVCTGIAAYFNADVTVVRLIAVLLLFITSGAAAAAYIVAMMIAPVAKTPEQKAAARGESFNSQELIDQARKKYAELANKEHWQTVVRENQPALTQAGNVVRAILKGIAAAVAIAAVVALTFIMMITVSGSVSLISTGQFFGLSLSPMPEPWLLAALLISAFTLLAVPLFFIAYDSYRYARHGRAPQNVWAVTCGVVLMFLAAMLIATLAPSSAALRENLQRFSAEHQNGGSLCIGICDDPLDATPTPTPDSASSPSVAPTPSPLSSPVVPSTAL